MTSYEKQENAKRMPIRAKASRYTVLLLHFDQSSINPFFFHAPLRQRNIMPTARLHSSAVRPI